jgi:hypothetical protein
MDRDPGIRERLDAATPLRRPAEVAQAAAGCQRPGDLRDRRGAAVDGGLMA